MKTGIEYIAEERARQQAVEGENFVQQHDDCHYMDELAFAAVAYALPPRIETREDWWPWGLQEWDHFKPAERVRELQKAGALIAAEIDRLNRNAACDPIDQ